VTDSADSDGGSWPRWLKWALWVVGGVALVCAFVFLPFGEWVTSFAAWAQAQGAVGIVLFAVFYVVMTVFALPGSLLTLAAGFVWGPGWGLLLVSPVSVAAASAAFLSGRYLFRDRVARRIAGHPKLEAIDDAIDARSTVVVILLRLSPLVPFSWMNYLMSMTSITFGRYVLASFVGMLPGTAMYVYIGSTLTALGSAATGEADKSPAEQIFFWVGLAATVGVSVFVTLLARKALKMRVNVKDEGNEDVEGGDNTGEGAAAPSVPNKAHERGTIRPDDAANRALLEAVHPSDWVNPTPSGPYNMVVIGGGTAGLVTAIATAGLGGKVALIERHLLGGDCLNVGCVPSKALLSAAKVAARARDAGRYGVSTGPVEVDFGGVMARLREIRARIAPNDSAARFREAGVDVYLGEARFVSEDAVEVGGQRLTFARAVVATGARASVPPIQGAAEVGVLTNETVFELTERPGAVAVIGGGPIGCELSQALRRLGCAVTLLDAAAGVLTKDDPDAARIVEKRLRAEGVDLHVGVKVVRLERAGDRKVVVLASPGGEWRIEVDEIVMATGRRPNVEGLGLEAAGVAFDKHGVTVDDRLRSTTNKRVYAAGDVCSKWQFTHAADAMARMVVQNALFWGRKRHSALTVPWCTYTDPEVAHVGPPVSDLDEADVERVITIELDDVDRAICDGQTDGFARFHLGKKGKILAATIVAANAGDMIAEVSLAMTSGLKMGAIGGAMHAYPTQVEVLKRAADAYGRTRLTPFVAGVLKRFLAWRR